MILRHPLYFIMVLLILLSVSVFAAPTSLGLVKEYETIFLDWEAVGDNAYLEMFSKQKAVKIVPYGFPYEITEYNLIILFQGNSLKGFTVDIIKRRLRFAIEF